MKYITSNPKILGGKSVIVNTRVPVERILFLLKEGYNLEAIHEEYPHIDLKILEGAIDELSKMVDNSSHASQTI